MAQKRLSSPTLVVAGPFGPAQTATTFPAVEVPAKTFVASVKVLVTTLLSGGSPSIDVGDGSDADGWVDTLQITEGAVGLYDGKRATTEANGTATIVNGQTTIAVTHGLGVTPGVNDIVVTPKANWGTLTEFWVTDPTSTDFDITGDADPGEDVAFAWQANVLVHADAAYYGGKYYATADTIDVVLATGLTAGVFYIIAELWDISGGVA